MQYARFVGDERGPPGRELIRTGGPGARRFSVKRDERDALTFDFAGGTLSNLEFPDGFDEDALACALASLAGEHRAGRLAVSCGIPAPAAARLRLHALGRPRSGISEPLLSALRNSFPVLAGAAYRLKSRLFPRSYVAKGRCGGLPLTVLLRTPGHKAALLSETLFDVPARAVPAGREDARDADLEILSVPESGAGGGDFATPSSVRAIIDIPATLAEYEKGLPHSARSDINKIRKAGFMPRISRDRDDFVLFYKSMHLPTLEAMHESNAVRPTFSELESLFRAGYLLFACRGDATLGGVLVQECPGRVLALKAIGVLEGSRALMRSGVGSALYYFSVSHACEKGVAMLDFGLGGPFRTTGLTVYKNKWKARFVTDTGEPVLSYRFKDAKVREHLIARLDPFLLRELEKFTRS
ncbi:MAG TPA: hypothetical protein VLD37_00995 [Candidatus Bilamarchaeum sp.]|nr:hypothetical protein [Candidatus Bilamarchaeum sp.]